MFKCKVCFDYFDAETELHAHLANVHGCGPLAPRPTCPESMLHVREMLIEAMIPDWMKEARDPADPRHELGYKSERLVRRMDEGIVDNLLSTLDSAGYKVLR